MDKAYCRQSIVSLPCLSFSQEDPPMLRRLPPLNALKAFEAAARHESFTRAAEELCVTLGAISHQVKALEAELGIKLFNRQRQRLVITLFTNTLVARKRCRKCSLRQARMAPLPAIWCDEDTTVFL
jgi:hypothetical protein